jgi:hypothetical protein
MSKMSEPEREIVKALLDSDAVNFEAIGATLARYGPTAVLNLDYEEGFCGTMRGYVRVFRLVDVRAPQIEDLVALRQEVSGEVRG